MSSMIETPKKIETLVTWSQKEFAYTQYYREQCDSILVGAYCPALDRLKPNQLPQPLRDLGVALDESGKKWLLPVDENGAAIGHYIASGRVATGSFNEDLIMAREKSHDPNLALAQVITAKLAKTDPVLRNYMPKFAGTERMRLIKLA